MVGVDVVHIYPNGSTPRQLVMYSPAMSDDATVRLPAKVMAVLGAGPKGISIAAKAMVLAELGFDVPQVQLIEACEPGANWNGRHGYTTGQQPLGTPPEKDLGYPYSSSCWGDKSKLVDSRMHRYSWHAYLVDVGDLASWVDRGRPQPEHRQWAEYLEWACGRCSEPLISRVDEIDLNQNSWRLRGSDGLDLVADVLVITGPGAPKHVPTEGERNRIFDGKTFWENAEVFRRTDKSTHVCVIGSGETAAAVAVELLRWSPKTKIKIFSPEGVIYSRGESFQENRYYSDPSDWKQLTVEHRRQFVRRTDRGVFSRYAKKALDAADNVEYLLGRVRKLVGEETRVLVYDEYGSDSKVQAFDYVVDAIGFDPLSFRALMTNEAAGILHTRCAFNATSSAPDVEPLIGQSLAVEGMDPPLHVPMLAAFAEGPGFPNLSALGLLSDRVLGPYCKASIQEAIAKKKLRQ